MGIKLIPACRFPFICCMVFALNQSNHVGIGLKGIWRKFSLEKLLILAIFSIYWPNCKLLDQKAYWGLIWHPRAPLKVPVVALDLARHHFLVYVCLGGVIGEKIENLAVKSDYEAVLVFKLFCFTYHVPSLQWFTQGLVKGAKLWISLLLFLTWREYFYSQPTHFSSQPKK